MGSNAGEYARASLRCAVIAKYMHLIASICSPKIVMCQYYWAVSPAWLCSAVHCSPNRGEEGQFCIYTFSSQKHGCVGAGSRQYFWGFDGVKVTES